MTDRTPISIRNIPVCVIGGAGFLGSHLVHYLIEERNCSVLVLDNLITGRLAHLPPEAKFQWYDIRSDEHQLTLLLKAYNIQAVFNYAAEPYIPECFNNPMHFFDINAVAVLRVLNAVEAVKCPLLQVSSAEIYGDSCGKINERSPIAPHSTYGVSKVAADGLVQVRWKEAGVPAIALRQFNCVGERETHEYVIPEIISQLEKGPEISLGNDSTRDFLYAGDAVRLAVELLERGSFGEVYNLGSESSIRIYALAAFISQQIYGYPNTTIRTDPARVRPWEIWHLESDNTKLYQTIEGRPQVSLPEALQRTVDYFHANGNKWGW